MSIAVDEFSIEEFLDKNEINEFTQASDFHGFLAIATTWGMVLFSFALVGLYPSIWSILVALVLLGGRHLALAILMHDASHYSLFRTRKLNDLLGQWICAYPTWQDLNRYRSHHRKHHLLAGTAEDPDYSLVNGFPITLGSLFRKFLRDLIGVTGVKRIYGLLLMDLGFIKYTVASDVIWLPQGGRSMTDVITCAITNLHGVVITNFILFGVLYCLGHPWLYLLWIGSYLVPFSLFVRIRSIAEHACTRSGLNPLDSTRTTHANPLARITVAPHRVNYHLEHHMLMATPNYLLPKLHRLLRERGAHDAAIVSKGYFDVLRIATRITR